ncbi:MAG: tail fiber domain-containing protein, partial [Bacteroidota bacterium]
MCYLRFKRGSSIRLVLSICIVLGLSSSDICAQVGIGTTSPTEMLDVEGNMIVGTPTGPSYITLNDVNTGLWRIGTGGFDLRFSNDFDGNSVFDPRVVISETGNLGIGVTNPNATLHLANVNSNRRITLWELANNDHQFYGFGTNGGLLRYQVSSISNAHAFFAANNSTSSTELMRISGNGRVGIGTSSPLAGLDIVRSTGADAALGLRAGNASTNFTNNQITFSFDGGALYRHAIKSRHSSGADAGNGLDFYVWRTADAATSVGSRHVMTIDARNGGSVGVGTTQPNGKFEVRDGDFLVTNGLTFLNNNTSGNQYMDLYNLNTGFGAGSRFNIGTDGGGDAWMSLSAGLQSYAIGIDNNDADKFKISRYFEPGINDYLTIDNTGRMGVGTNSPLQRLHVQGSTYMTDRLSVGVDTPTGQVEFRNGGQSIYFNDDPGNPSIELRDRDNNNGTPFIDFSNDASSDFDMRLILAGNDQMNIDGGTLVGLMFNTSDARFKTNIASISSATSLLAAIQPKTFRWNQTDFPERQFDDRLHYGVIAQELEPLLPDLVQTDDKGHKSVNYIELVPILVKGFQEEHARNAELEGQVESL